MQGTCRLCGKATELLESHLFPKFVFRWMRETGGRYFRNVNNPNQRLQDGPKAHLLCFDCEQRLGRDEKWFSENVFYPYIDEKRRQFPYDESLYYFSVSLLWRVLESSLRKGLDGGLEHWIPTLRLVDREWQDFLVRGISPPTYSGVHLFLTDIGIGASPVEGMNMYFGRGADAEVIGNDSRCLVYAKLPRFLFFGGVTPILQKPEHRTRIEPGGGVLQLPQTLADKAIGSHLVDRIRETRERQDERMSADQHKKIEAQLVRDAAHLVGSDLFEAHTADHNAVIKPIVPRNISGNDKCPCGSGKRFERCHGTT